MPNSNDRLKFIEDVLERGKADTSQLHLLEAELKQINSINPTERSERLLEMVSYQLKLSTASGNDESPDYPEGFMSSAFEEMRKKLLDISGSRSRLIDLNHNRRGVVRFVDELPGQLGETLLNEKAMTVIPVPEPSREQLIKHGYLEWDKENHRLVPLKDDPDEKEWAKVIGLKNEYDLPFSSEHADDDRHTDLDLQSLLFEHVLNVSLKKLASEAKTSIDETGNNILFLSLGFLEWYDQADESRKRLAPLYMIPVRIERTNVKGIAVYKLKYTGEDIIPNLTLKEKLSIEFDLTLPSVVNPEDQLLSPEQYFSEVNALIERKSNNPIVSKWRVRRFGTLATLSLGKLLMYLDLDPTRWPQGEGNLLQHDVIRQFFQNETRQPVSVSDSSETYVLDDVPDIHDQFPMIEDADSSQMSVLIDVLKGGNMMVEGPPGTGKSQTITNLISAAMAQGKTILFVAEKQAALDVVKRRMDKAGLGDFCLDLHSDKARKRLVLDGFSERIAKQNHYTHSVADYDVQVARYERAREQLQDYANMVNQPWKDTGLTIHEVLSAATRYGREVAPLKYKDVAPEGISGSNFTRVQLDQKLEDLERFYTYLGIISKQLNDDGNWLSHPWYGIENKQLVRVDHDEIVDLVKNWNTVLSGLVESFSERCDELSISPNQYRTLPALEKLISSWSALPSLTGSECLPAFRNIPPDVFSKIARSITCYKNISDAYKNARTIFVPELVENLDKVNEIDDAISGLSSLGVTPSTSFDELAKAVALLEGTLATYQKISQIKAELIPHINDELITLFPATPLGLQELGLFVKHAAALPAKYIKHREDVFDTEELPAILEEARARLDGIAQEKENQANIFDLGALPSAATLREHSAVLSETSMFSWLNSSWREVKRSVLEFSKEEKIDYIAMSAALEEAAKWLEDCAKFENSERYREVLGTQFRGLKTDFVRTAALSDWYRGVRKDYGIGFGRRVPLAASLFTVEADILQGIQNLESENFLSNLNEFLEGRKHLSLVFAKEDSFTDEDVQFDQDVNPLQMLLLKIREHLQVSQGYLLASNLSLSRLVSGIAGLQELRYSLSEVIELDINARYFDGQLDLSVDDKGRLPPGLALVSGTLKYLKSLYECSDNHDLLAIIVNSTDPKSIVRVLEDGARFQKCLSDIQSREEEFMALSGSTRDLWFSFSGLEIDSIIQRNTVAENSGEWLGGWLAYLFAKDRMETGGFGLFKQYLTADAHSLEHVQKVMKFATYQCLAQELYQEQPGLAERSGHEQTALQVQFAKYDEKLKRLQRKRVAALTAQRDVPSGTSGALVASFSDAHLLKHEVKKKSRHISIRNLVKRAGPAMQAYKPCFMMSPMAVAKYIPPDSIKFDLVVMDEASQVKPEYALSSFARGTQIIVVGDPKQLPPTTFFERSVSNDWNGDDDGGIIEESDSILDAFSGQFPSRQLRWHYRSRHESLIEFSNHRFYDSSLVVFPSPWSQSDEYGIKFNYVKSGRFLKSVNVPESQAVVRAIREHLVNCPNESLGIVAMNSKQREQIEAGLEAAVASDGVLRAAYEKNNQSEDPLFIKNLENVQGDERDVIFISFTYGPQEKGSTDVPQRFGPINEAGGWRRLNVLFTRSKKRIQVYSSMTAEQIVLSEKSSRGVESLKGYLDFAKTGRLVGQDGTKQREPDSDFEIAVMDALQRKGYECVPQVGVAGYFIDLAVRDPGMPGRYLMGIECDGATYHSSKSTRDRDCVKQGVLKGLGWNIRRIWSTDWFRNSEAELKPIIEELESLATPISASPDLELVPDEAGTVGLAVVDTEAYLSSASHTLEERLVDFAVNVVEKECPETEPEKRLLRPDMLKRLVSDRPTSREDFTVFIPGYLRTHTCANEAEKYLDEVIEIIADDESTG